MTARRWQALRERLDPANDESAPGVPLILTRWAMRLVPWALAAIAAWFFLAPRPADVERIHGLIEQLTRDPQAIPVKSSDGRDLYRYEYTQLGTTSMVWTSADDWWLRVESPRFRLDDLAPNRERVDPDSPAELYRVIDGKLAGSYVLRTPLEIDVYSAAYYDRNKP